MQPDDFLDNNEKSFAFFVPSEIGRSVRSVFGIGEAGLDEEDNWFTYRGSFLLSSPVRPDQKGVDIAIHGHAPYVSTQAGNPASFVYHLPGGSRWWYASNPGQGHWIYHDPKGLAGPVTLLKIHQGRSPRYQDLVAKVAFKTRAENLQALRTAHAYSVEVGMIADGLQLATVSSGSAMELPPRVLPPSDEEEEEPGWPSPQQPN